MLPLYRILICWAIIFLAIIMDHHVDSAITITKILAGKKKFKTYSLGLSFLPTLVKVKPNKFHLTIRQNRYIRPKKFKMDGSLPLKVPTILVPKRNPYAPSQDININADLSIGPEDSKKYNHYATSSNPEPVFEQPPSSSENEPQTSETKLNQQVDGFDSSLDTLLPPPLHLFLPPPSVPFMSSISNEYSTYPSYNGGKLSPQPESQTRTEIKRNLNLGKPYHHHLNSMMNDDRIRQMKLIMSSQLLRSPLLMHNTLKYSSSLATKSNRLVSTPSPILHMPVVPWQTHLDVTSASSNPVARQMSIELSEMSIDDTPKEHRPMKINIGEHYDPNMIYMDEQLTPSSVSEEPVMESQIPTQQTPLFDGDLVDSVVAESIPYYMKYDNKKNNKYKNDGPDDIRIDFSLTGPHGGPMVPYGFGKDQEQLNKQLNKIQQHIPIGLHAKQIYNYYLRHTFTEPVKAWPYSYAKVRKVKLLPERKKKSRPPSYE